MSGLWQLYQFGRTVSDFCEEAHEDLWDAMEDRLILLAERGTAAREPVSESLKREGLFALRANADNLQGRLLYFFGPERKQIIFVHAIRLKKTSFQTRTSKRPSRRKRWCSQTLGARMPSELIGRIRFKLADKIRNPARRRKMFARMAQDEIAMEVRALREKRGFRTQAAFAKHVHMQQSAVSRIENAEYQGWTFKTLLRVAHALDARLRVSFEPAEDFQRRFDESERTAEIEGADSAANAALLIEATTTTHGLIIRKHQEDPRWQSLGTDLEPMASIVVDENPHALTAGAIDILRGNQWQRDPH